METKQLRTTTYLAVAIITCLCVVGCATTPYSKADKALYGTVAALQVVDGLTTVDLNKGGTHIKDKWAWKYHTDTPSPTRLWGVKAAELAGAYVVGRYLPPAWRKGFFLAVDVLLIHYIQGNLQLGAGYSITY